MIDRLEKTLARYNEIKEELSKQEVISDIELLTKLSKEQSSMEEVISKYKRYKEVLSNIEEDKELSEMVKKEFA